MMHYLRYCCAMFFALISFLLAPPLSAQAQTREAYVAQSADTTTLTFYYDDQRATHTGTTCGIEVKKGEGRLVRALHHIGLAGLRLRTLRSGEQETNQCEAHRTAIT